MQGIRPPSADKAIPAELVGLRIAIEWYDFFLYSTVTPLVFAKLFFPKSDPLVGTLQAFLVYTPAAQQRRSPNE